ncbi:MAG: hypothetical protein PHX08_06960 [Lachnospiraceae bacterium]|nr:hypothetical protein [Lachnospiraceae bacterium]
MEEREMNSKELFDFINNHEGEFFVRVILTEEGEVCGETSECGVNSISRRTATYE